MDFGIVSLTLSLQVIPAGLFVNGASMVTLLRWSNLSTPCSMSSRASWLMKTVHPTNLLPRKLYGVSCTELLVSYDYSCIGTRIFQVHVMKNGAV